MSIDLRGTDAAENIVSSSSGLSSQAFRDVGFALPPDPEDEVNRFFETSELICQ